MSFKVRPLHDRIFKPVVQQPTETTGTEVVEDTVFVVDEENGEIREETQMVEREITGTKTATTELPKKESARILGLSMKKKTKVSFM